MQENRCLIIKCIFNAGFPVGYCQVNAKECKLRDEGFRNLEKAMKEQKNKQGGQIMTIHIDFSISDDCINIQDSYGEICVKCNCCGRFDEKTKYEARIKTYKRQLEESNSFDGWWEGAEELQRANVKANAEYLGELIAEAEKEMVEQG